eukprot:scaffold116164_cov71-Attheya_sp.AAC.1
MEQHSPSMGDVSHIKTKLSLCELGHKFWVISKKRMAARKRRHRCSILASGNFALSASSMCFSRVAESNEFQGWCGDELRQAYKNRCLSFEFTKNTQDDLLSAAFQGSVGYYYNSSCVARPMNENHLAGQGEETDIDVVSSDLKNHVTPCLDEDLQNKLHKTHQEFPPSLPSSMVSNNNLSDVEMSEPSLAGEMHKSHPENTELWILPPRNEEDSYQLQITSCSTTNSTSTSNKIMINLKVADKMGVNLSGHEYEVEEALALQSRATRQLTTCFAC